MFHNRHPRQPTTGEMRWEDSTRRPGLRLEDVPLAASLVERLLSSYPDRSGIRQNPGWVAKTREFWRTPLRVNPHLPITLSLPSRTDANLVSKCRLGLFRPLLCTSSSRTPRKKHADYGALPRNPMPQRLRLARPAEPERQCIPRQEPGNELVEKKFRTCDTEIQLGVITLSCYQ